MVNAINNDIIKLLDSSNKADVTKFNSATNNSIENFWGGESKINISNFVNSAPLASDQSDLQYYAGWFDSEEDTSFPEVSEPEENNWVDVDIEIIEEDADNGSIFDGLFSFGDDDENEE